VINSLRARYPGARVSHAFASTEAGVGFAVDDGYAGFPVNFVGTVGNVEVQVINGSLCLRSPGVALRFLGNPEPIAGADGFVNTGDAVEQRGDRYYFLGRTSGVINVGGLKVYPEEVEAVINRHPAVCMSRVCGKRSPITGALVAADVVLETSIDGALAEHAANLKQDIQMLCRRRLAPHKVPATIRIVPRLELSAAGKLARVVG
jgi:acyl-CoA synthetase (AMP-forming)/AMP-acid ligase II